MKCKSSYVPACLLSTVKRFVLKDWILLPGRYTVESQDLRCKFKMPIINTELFTLPSSSKCGATQFSGLSMNGFSRWKPTKENQDAVMVLFDTITDTLVVACLDGHGEFGDKVAQFIRNKIQLLLVCHPCFASDIKTAVLETIETAEAMLLQRHYRECCFSGTTLSLAIIRDNKIITANIGDSRIVLSRNGVASALSTDHKADLPEERERIIQAGGRVLTKVYEDGYIGPARVYLPHTDSPGLAMSRSIGDYVIHEAGVTSTPEICEYDIVDEDGFMIVGTDGIWDFITNQEVVDTASNYSSADAALNSIVRESVAKWTSKFDGVMDDTSTIVVFFRGLTRCNDPFREGSECDLELDSGAFTTKDGCTAYNVQSAGDIII